MKNFGIQVAEGSVITNITIPSGTSFPANDNVGEMFYRTDTDQLYIRDNTTWEAVTTTTDLTAYVEKAGDTMTGELIIEDATLARLSFAALDQAVDEKYWNITTNNSLFKIQSRNDSDTFILNAVEIDRAGTVEIPQALTVNDSPVLTESSTVVAGFNLVKFTSNGTYTKPANLIAAEITVVGGGAGGGGVDGAGVGTSAAGGGGGSGASGISILQDSEISANTTITIGGGGAGGAGGGGTGGGSGGQSSFGGTVTALGGLGGVGRIALDTTNIITGNGGNGGNQGVADMAINGAPGGFGVAGGSSTNESNSGFGGSSTMGGGAAARSGDNTGTAAIGAGGGGSGASVNNVTTDFAGGAGHEGVVIIKEYLSV